MRNVEIRNVPQNRTLIGHFRCLIDFYGISIVRNSVKRNCTTGMTNWSLFSRASEERYRSTNLTTNLAGV